CMFRAAVVPDLLCTHKQNHFCTLVHQRIPHKTDARRSVRMPVLQHRISMPSLNIPYALKAIIMIKALLF
ncbi:hypothetical protein, partial [Klebsiella pneumoniae]|uniref:hypothetical protein n=1 Tax=Klebsiella pneumoniae TaxID=573 RepID=UPI001CDB4F74